MLVNFYPLHGVTSLKKVFFIVTIVKTESLVRAVTMKPHTHCDHFVIATNNLIAVRVHILQCHMLLMDYRRINMEATTHAPLYTRDAR